MGCTISSLVKYLLIFTLLVPLQPLLPFNAASAWAAAQKADGQAQMDFIVVRAADCEENCPEWISAEGRITGETPGRLKKTLKRIGDRKLPVVFRSEGGEVSAAYAMGRMIRKSGLETAVGGTRLQHCPIQDMRCKAAIAKDGSSLGVTYSGGAFCLSACPLALAGGTARVASQWAYIGVHQITTIYDKIRVSYRIEYKMVKGKKQEVARKEIGRKLAGQSKSTKLGKKAAAVLDAYLKEMGVSDGLIALMMSASPENIRLLPPVEALKLGLITDMLASNESPGIPLCAKDHPATARCHRHEALVSAPASAVTEPPAATPAQGG